MWDFNPLKTLLYNLMNSYKKNLILKVIPRDQRSKKLRIKFLLKE